MIAVITWSRNEYGIKRERMASAQEKFTDNEDSAHKRSTKRLGIVKNTESSVVTRIDYALKQKIHSPTLDALEELELSASVALSRSIRSWPHLGPDDPWL